MTKITFLKTIPALVLAVALFSCGGSKPETTTTEPTETQPAGESDAAESTEAISGSDLFTSSGCVACHQPEVKTVGPSLKEISAAYEDNSAGLLKFMTGEGSAIVDPAQEAVMKPQTETTKAMSDAERNALVDFILSN